MSKDKKRSVFAENIIRRRKALGWSQSELADRSGFTRGLIAIIEIGKTEGSIHSREVLAQTLGCEVSDLYRDPTPQMDDKIRPLHAHDIVKAVLERTDIPHEIRVLALALIWQTSENLAKLSPHRKALLYSLLKERPLPSES